MPTNKPQTAHKATVTSHNEPIESVWSLAAFWLVAFTGSGLFGAVLLAPKWEQQQLHGIRVRELVGQCDYLGEMNAHLNRVIEAFKHDPDFTEEVARYELGYVIPDEQRLPAPVRKWNHPKPPQPEIATPEIWAPFVHLFAHDSLVRKTAMITAGVFIIVGLAFFNPTREQ